MTKVKEGYSYYIYPFDPEYGEIEVSEVFIKQIDKAANEALVVEQLEHETRERWLNISEYTWDLVSYPSDDDVVEEVVSEYRQRSSTGKQKYGTTLSENPADLKEWLNHLQEELMDAVLYIQRAKEEV